MATITITNTEFTQINTDATTYLAQVTSASPVRVIAAATLPVPTTEGGYILQQHDAISNADIESLLWGITQMPDGASIEVN